MNRYPKASKVIRDHDYTPADNVGTNYLAKKFRRIELELKREKAEREAAEQAAHKKVRQLRKTA